MEAIREAVFISDNGFEKSNLPSQCVISDKLPRNSAGKVDVYRIREKGAPGQSMKVEAIRTDGRLTDIKLHTLNGKEQVAGFAHYARLRAAQLHAFELPRTRALHLSLRRMLMRRYISHSGHLGTGR